MTKFSRSIAFSSFAALASLAHPYGTWVGQTTYTNLYDSSGNSVYTSSYVVSASFDMQYSGTFTTVGNTITDHYDPISGLMTTTVKIKYNNNQWGSAPNSAVVGVQAINYWHYLANGQTNCTLTIAAEFGTPSTSIFTMAASGHESWSFTYDTTYSDVNPRLFQVNKGTTDPGDTSGDTAEYVYSVSSTSYNPPWQWFPQYSNSYDSTKGAAGLLPAIWLFAKPTAGGVAHAGQPDYTTSGG